MKTISKLALATALSGALAAPAFAGGYAEPVVEPVIEPAPVYVAPSTDWTGGYVGGSLGFGEIDDGATDGDGMTYGLRAGYDYDFGGWVLGAGIDYDWSEMELDGGAGTVDSIARVKLRAGADLGNTLLYGTAGLARAEAELGGVEMSDNGWFGGIGADYRLNDSWTVGGELLVHRFDDFDGSGIDLDATTLGLNVGFRF